MGIREAPQLFVMNLVVSRAREQDVFEGLRQGGRRLPLCAEIRVVCIRVCVRRAFQKRRVLEACAEWPAVRVVRDL